MKEKLQDLETRRLELVKSFNKNIKIGVLLLIPAAILITVSVRFDQAFVMFIAIIIFIAAMVYFGKAAAQAHKFRQIIKTDLIRMLLAEQFTNVYYDPKESIPIRQIMSTRTIRNPDRFKGEDYIKGTYKGVDFEVSDVEMKKKEVRTDSKGNTHVSYVTYFKGRWYTYKFQKKFDQVLKIIEGRAGFADTRNLEKFDTESIEFNKKFDIYSSTKEFGFYLITSSMIEKLLELEKLHRGSILYCFQDNELHIGINDRKDYMEFKLKTPINEENIGVFMSDIELIPAIVNEFRLDSVKFK